MSGELVAGRLDSTPSSDTLLLLPSGISVVGIASLALKLVELYPGQHQRDLYHDWREGLGLHQGRVLEGDSVSLGEGFDVDRGIGMALTCFEGVGSGSPAPPHAPKRPTPAASDTVRNKVFKNFIVCETVPSTKSLPG